MSLHPTAVPVGELARGFVKVAQRLAEVSGHTGMPVSPWWPGERLGMDGVWGLRVGPEQRVAWWLRAVRLEKQGVRTVRGW